MLRDDTAAGNNGECQELVEALDRLPQRQPIYAVLTQQEENFCVGGKALVHFEDRVDGVGRAFTRDLEINRRHSCLMRQRAIEHLQSHGGRCQRSGFLQRRLAGRNEKDVRQTKVQGSGAGSRNVPVVNRIEASAKQADPRHHVVFNQ